MNPSRRLFYLVIANTCAFIVGSQIAHVWLNPMHDYKDFIARAEDQYQAEKKELHDVEEYLAKKRQQRTKQTS